MLAIIPVFENQRSEQLIQQQAALKNNSANAHIAKIVCIGFAYKASKARQAQSRIKH